LKKKLLTRYIVPEKPPKVSIHVKPRVNEPIPEVSHTKVKKIIKKAPAPAPTPTPAGASKGFTKDQYDQFHSSIVDEKPDFNQFTFELVQPVIQDIMKADITRDYASVRAYLTQQKKKKVPSFLKLKELGVSEPTTASYIFKIYKQVSK
jgi:hypothetical protein